MRQLASPCLFKTLFTLARIHYYKVDSLYYNSFIMVASLTFKFAALFLFADELYLVAKRADIVWICSRCELFQDASELEVEFLVDHEFDALLVLV